MKIHLWRYLIITLFSTIVLNALFLLDESVFGWRNLFVFVFFLTVPGYLILKLFKSNVTVSWKDTVYIVGLSTAFLIIVGLIANYVTPLVAKVKPLERMPLLAAIDISLALLFIGNVVKLFIVKEVKKEPREGFKINVWNCIFFAVPLLFPLLALAGVAILNNGGPNTILLIYLFLIPVYFTILFFVNEKVNENVFPYSLYMISLALLLHSSMRGWNISGTDILREYHIFRLTFENGHWAPDLIKHTYNACLSINILPTFFAKFIEGDIQYIFKFYLQFIYAFSPVAVYFFTKNFTTKLVSFLSAFFYLSFPIFLYTMSMHIRQEFAFLFFCLILMALFDDKLSFRRANVMAMIFGFCMIVSHYSTTYLALGFFLFWYLARIALYWIFKIKPVRKLLVGAHHTTTELFSTTKMSLLFVVFLFGAAFFWYTQIVNIGGDVINFGNKVSNNLSKIFKNDLLPDQNSLANQFNIFYKPVDKAELLNKYFTSYNRRPSQEIDAHFYPRSSYKDFYPQLKESKTLPQKAPDFVYTIYNIYSELIKKSQKLMMIIGVMLFIFIQLRRRQIDSDLLVISMGSLGIILAFIVVPFFSLDYDLLRATQQFLIILAFTTLFAISTLFDFIKKPQFSPIVCCVVIVSYFVINTFSITQLVGKGNPPYLLNNFGAGYERSIVFDTEIASAKWLENNKKDYLMTQSDADSQSRIFMATLTNFTILPNILPGALYKAGYVYLNDLNVTQDVLNTNYNGNALRFTIPSAFIDENKNLIYSNGSSKIYR